MATNDPNDWTEADMQQVLQQEYEIAVEQSNAFFESLSQQEKITLYRLFYRLGVAVCEVKL